MRKFLSMIFLLATVMVLHAQQRTVTGTVRDENGEPVGFVTVTETGTKNAVQANVRAMLSNDIREHQVVNIAFGERTTLNQLWENITGMLGVSLKPKYRDFRAGDVKHSLASIEKAKNVIGYTPRISVKDGLKMSVDWYKRAQSPVPSAELSN